VLEIGKDERELAVVRAFIATGKNIVYVKNAQVFPVCT